MKSDYSQTKVWDWSKRINDEIEKSSGRVTEDGFGIDADIAPWWGNGEPIWQMLKGSCPPLRYLHWYLDYFTPKASLTMTASFVWRKKKRKALSSDDVRISEKLWLRWEHLCIQNPSRSGIPYISDDVEQSSCVHRVCIVSMKGLSDYSTWMPSLPMCRVLI